jgi:hypothetical protein
LLLIAALDRVSLRRRDDLLVLSLPPSRRGGHPCGSSRDERLGLSASTMSAHLGELAAMCTCRRNWVLGGCLCICRPVPTNTSPPLRCLRGPRPRQVAPLRHRKWQRIDECAPPHQMELKGSLSALVLRRRLIVMPGPAPRAELQREWTMRTGPLKAPPFASGVMWSSAELLIIRHDLVAQRTQRSDCLGN